MNQANVDALKTVLHEALETTEYDTPIFVDFLAKELSLYGVLAPSAVTEENLRDMVWDTVRIEDFGDDGQCLGVDYADIPKWLERIAKGSDA